MKHRIVQIIWLWLLITSVNGTSYTLYVAVDGMTSGTCQTPSTACTLEYLAPAYGVLLCDPSNEIRIDRGSYNLITSSGCGYVVNFEAYYNNGGTWEADPDPSTHIFNGPVDTLVQIDSKIYVNGFTFSGLGSLGQGTFNRSVFTLAEGSEQVKNCLFIDCYAPLFVITSDEDGVGPEPSNPDSFTVSIENSSVIGMIDDGTALATVGAITVVGHYLFLDNITVTEYNATVPSFYCSGNGSSPYIVSTPPVGICSANPISCTGCTCDSLTSPGECLHQSTCLSDSTCGKCIRDHCLFC